MNAVDLIEKKRTGQKLTSFEIEKLVNAYVQGVLPDYQMAAFLMAVMFQGLDVQETSALTMAMARSGDILDLSSVSRPVVDKHSTGGVGDKVSLIIGPVMASLGVSFAKMSGRGLGYTGGTADKLMSIPGYKINLPSSEFIKQVKDIKIALIGQSGNIVPADKKIYALRDVTATVESIALMTASVMSKKIATGADAILLDVKCGDGSFMKDIPAAKKLAQLMIKIGQELGKNVRAEISNMSRPLGKAIGNRIEVLEALNYLSGQVIPDLDELIKSSCQTLLLQARPSLTSEQAAQQVNQVITQGKALEKFKEWMIRQGVDFEHLRSDNFWKPKYSHEIFATSEGVLDIVSAVKFGTAAMKLGAGRETKDQEIDYDAGIYLHHKSGERVKKGDLLFTLYSSNPIESWQVDLLADAYKVGQSYQAQPMVWARI
ncbi:thymidine phosphorylase [Mycoplasma sp. ATU-Cv-508]|uniref:thymidine phosphorylase n=1 Tax=Mycoplasma sp. ATU-Cv-508 TaxID=2048001 RepID=UPI000FDE94D7